MIVGATVARGMRAAREYAAASKSTIATCSIERAIEVWASRVGVVKQLPEW